VGGRRGHVRACPGGFRRWLAPRNDGLAAAPPARPRLRVAQLADPIPDEQLGIY
jgi:hypothetical protein